MKRISKYLLLCQAPFLGYFTLLGLLLCAGAMLPALTGSFSKEHLSAFVAGVIILLALLAGWRVWFWIMADGPAERRPIHAIWWLFATLGLSSTLLSFLLPPMSRLVYAGISMPYQELFELGVFFIPSALHIVFEIWWQRRANQSFQRTAASGVR